MRKSTQLTLNILHTIITILSMYFLFQFISGMILWLFMKIRYCIENFNIYILVFLGAAILVFLLELTNLLITTVSVWIVTILFKYAPSKKYGAYSISTFAILSSAISIIQFWQIPHEFHFLQIAGCITYSVIATQFALATFAIYTFLEE